MVSPKENCEHLNYFTVLCYDQSVKFLEREKQRNLLIMIIASHRPFTCMSYHIDGSVNTVEIFLVHTVLEACQ